MFHWVGILFGNRRQLAYPVENVGVKRDESLTVYKRPVGYGSWKRPRYSANLLLGTVQKSPSENVKSSKNIPGITKSVET